MTFSVGESTSRPWITEVELGDGITLPSSSVAARAVVQRSH